MRGVEESRIRAQSGALERLYLRDKPLHALLDRVALPAERGMALSEFSNSRPQRLHDILTMLPGWNVPKPIVHHQGVRLINVSQRIQILLFTGFFAPHAWHTKK